MIELKIGQEYLLSNEVGGVMAVEVKEFLRHGNVALLMPNPVMAAWFKKGYTLGSAHWSKLTPVHGDGVGR